MKASGWAEKIGENARRFKFIGNSISFERKVSNIFCCRLAAGAFGGTGDWQDAGQLGILAPGQRAAVQPVQSGFMKAHFIDVDQGDSILVQLSSGKNILIGAGTDSAPVIAYLRRPKTFYSRLYFG